MASVLELAQRVLRKFANVPNEVEITTEDATAWVEEAALAHGYSYNANELPDSDELLVLLYAQAVGAEQLAILTAGFYVYTDDEETINKTNVGDQYRRLATALWERYKRQKAIGDGGSSFSIMTRVDRRWRQ